MSVRISCLIHFRNAALVAASDTLCSNVMNSTWTLDKDDIVQDNHNSTTYRYYVKCY